VRPMLKRLVLGLVIGVVVGGVAAAVLVSGLHVLAFTGDFGALLAYGAAATTGALTGLVAGKPVWAADAKVEAGLKAFFGALLAAGAMFALRQWGQGWTLDLAPLHAGGEGPIGALPAASLPLIAAVLGGLLELDNSDASADPAQRKRVAPPSGASSRSSARVEEDEDAHEAGAAKRARR
jgi:hypothetical protein